MLLDLAVYGGLEVSFRNLFIPDIVKVSGERLMMQSAALERLYSHLDDVALLARLKLDLPPDRYIVAGPVVTIAPFGTPYFQFDLGMDRGGSLGREIVAYGNQHFHGFSLTIDGPAEQWQVMTVDGFSSRATPYAKLLVGYLHRQYRLAKL